MAQPGSSQPPPTSSMTDNPVEAVVAVGRRVKSALSSHQQPSVRIRRETFLGERHRVPVLGSIAEQLVPHRPAHGNAQAAELPQHHAAPAKENTFANRLAGAGNRAGASVRSLFGHEKPSTENGPLEYDEYDADTVDLLDVVGMYTKPDLGARALTLSRPRSINTFHSHQRPKFALCPFARQSSQSPSYI
jgi:hypothetical protein